MADVEMTPVEMTPVAAEPPKANPLKPTAVLKPGLRLPPKPGALGAGLKLPPKPAPLGAGLKLPPKPGATIIAKPMIRKPGAPGALGAAKPLPKPVLPKPAVPAPAAAPAPTAAAPAPEMKTVDNPVATPFTKAVETAVPPPPPPAAAPSAPAIPAAPAMEQLKAVTQKLKGVTQQIPAQAILHKTGIIADSAQSEAQKEAAKHKTARISLNEAIGAAPVKSEPAPMKTIRIKRPIDIASKAPATAVATEGKPAEAAGKPAETPATPQAAAPAGGTSVTQKKTLKIQRPGGAVRPGANKFAVKKPGAPAPAAAASAPADKPAEGGDIPEIADIPEMPMTPVASAAKEGSDVPAWFTGLSAAVGLAACVVAGALAYYLYENAQLATFCGGLGWGA